MNIVAIYGSHRRNKNSDLLLDKVLDGIGENFANVTRIYASSPEIHHCAACGGCDKEGICVLKDEMQSVLTALDKADIVITSTPVYFYTVTSHLKKLIDRCQSVWTSKYVLKNSTMTRKNRLGYVLCTAGAPEEKSYFDCTLKVLNIFYLCINTRLEDVMLISNVDKAPVEKNEEILERAINFGKKIKKTLEPGR